MVVVKLGSYIHMLTSAGGDTHITARVSLGSPKSIIPTGNSDGCVGSQWKQNNLPAVHLKYILFEVPKKN